MTPLKDQMKEVLKLIAETGDRCIVLQENHDPYVVMNLESYRALLTAAAKKENIATMSETELLNKINQEIDEWRESQRAELAEYDLDQFRVDAPPAARFARKTSQMSSSLANTAFQFPPVKHRESPVDNLPVVQNVPESEYKLEPLG